jgi:hypothetical protein
MVKRAGNDPNVRQRCSIQGYEALSDDNLRQLQKDLSDDWTFSFKPSSPTGALAAFISNKTTFIISGWCNYFSRGMAGSLIGLDTNIGVSASCHNHATALFYQISGGFAGHLTHIRSRFSDVSGANCHNQYSCGHCSMW